MRAKSLLVVLLVVIGLVVPVGAAAAAKRASGPVLERPATRATAVVFTGRARSRAVVRLQVRGASRWVTVRTTRAARSGAYRVATRYPTRLRAYRTVSRGRASAIRRVAPKPKPKPAPSDACGVQPPRPGGGHYDCTFHDAFDGTELDPTRWMGMEQPGHSDLCITEDPSTVAVADGLLRLTARPTGGDLQCPERADGTRAPYAGAWVTTYQRWSQQFGRFEARIKVQAASAPGLHEAFWLWPDTRYASDKEWPATGEIDIMETYSQHADLAVPFLHYNADDNGGPVPGLNTAWNCIAPRGQWHTYVLEWSADRLEIFVDGKSCLVNTAGAGSFHKPFIINLTQFLGGGTNLFTGLVDLPATMEVDYVKAWS